VWARQHLDVLIRPGAAPKVPDIERDGMDAASRPRASFSSWTKLTWEADDHPREGIKNVKAIVKAVTLYAEGRPRSWPVEVGLVWIFPGRFSRKAST